MSARAWQLSAQIKRTIAVRIGRLTVECLHLEVDTFPKPGLVSHVDAGAHRDMDARLLYRSADTLEPFFVDLAAAGAAGATMDRLRAIGMAAERAMLGATQGVNTHRGAIFGLGLLAAAAAFRHAHSICAPLGRFVADRWGRAILNGPIDPRSHGARAVLRYGIGGARQEAASGFDSIYRIAIPALAAGVTLAKGEDEAARVHACMALIASVGDTNLLHRGGRDALEFARRSAGAFLDAGSVGQPAWREQALRIHEEFIKRNLGPGGSADLLAMALFVRALEHGAI